MTQTFPDGLKDQTDRGDEIGAFATEVGEFDDFPDSGGKPIFDGYFETSIEENRTRYERAWSEYSASPEPSVS
ncbi:hypothetical protein [Naasia lichenicola]|uniref:YozE SAM-like domain-containing protein n=1 Tax=Naasia lichenicola TaxID=2565933 RepID=A0A4S4FTT5_9MICO|nr:hypothetical protein [Naasia lichenicola]THG33175.1 hypothetical protein E6C64_02125 [Naasia lichenicola]